MVQSVKSIFSLAIVSRCIRLGGNSVPNLKGVCLMPIPKSWAELIFQASLGALSEDNGRF